MRIATRSLAALVLIALLVLLCRRVEWGSVLDALRHASLPLVLLATALNLFVNIGFKAARWRVLMLPLAKVRLLRLYYYLIVSYAASAVLPARAGEALRVYLLRRRDQVPVADAVGVVVVEKLFEIIGLLAVVLPLPLLMPLPHWVQLSIWAVGVGGAVAIALSVLIARRAHTSDSRWAELARGLACMRSPSHVAQASLFSILAYVTDAIEIWLVLRAFGIVVPWATPGLVLLGANLAIAVPSTPGQLGALEAGVVAALAVVGVPVATALAFGLVYHFMQLIPIVLIGLTGFHFVAEAQAETKTEPASVAPLPQAVS